MDDLALWLNDYKVVRESPEIKLLVEQIIVKTATASVKKTNGRRARQRTSIHC